MIKSFLKKLFRPVSPGPRKMLRARHHGPRTVPHSVHGIDPHRVSRHAIRVCETLQQHHYQAYIVGGAVRDLMLGKTPKDFDVATNATPEQIQALFRRARIIGRRFRLVHVMFGAETIETSTFRATADADSATDEHGRLLRDNVFGNQESDAARRDFSVNALYYDPVTQTVIDFHDGVKDLQARCLRMIGDPAQRYREDPVRMLRAVRFAAKLGFSLDANTEAPIKAMAHLLANVPEARLFDELLKLLSSGAAMKCLRGLREAGLQNNLMPGLVPWLEDPEAAAFIERGLARTDARVQAGKSISPGFLFITLCWPAIARRWALLAQNQPSLPALQQAIDDVLHEQTRGLAIQRRFVADLQEIAMMQPRFERRQPRSVWRMAEQPRFRAAVDFLGLRAEAGEVDIELARWWHAFADGDLHEREALLEQALAKPLGTESGGTSKRRRRSRGRGRGAAAADANAPAVAHD
jgi:poly(A) polymerase